MTSKLTLFTLAASLLTVTASHAATITFDSANDFDSNFWAPGGNLALRWTSVGRIQRSWSESGADILIYNTTSTGVVTTGMGGTSASPVQNTFQDVILQSVHRVSSVGSTSTSTGFWVKGSSDGTSGYLVVFRLASQNDGTGSADMRIFGPNTNATTNTVGTPVMASTGFTPTSTVAASKDYTFRVQIQDVAGGVNFIGSMWDTATGNQIGSDINFTHTGETALTGAGQIGIRIGSASNVVSTMDNLVITVIPEPSAALLGLVAVAGGMLRRRK
jgi:hypothetical protein